MGAIRRRLVLRKLYRRMDSYLEEGWELDELPPELVRVAMRLGWEPDFGPDDLEPEVAFETQLQLAMKLQRRTDGFPVPMPSDPPQFPPMKLL